MEILELCRLKTKAKISGTNIVHVYVYLPFKV